MTKRIIYIVLPLLLTAYSCKNKELCYEDHHKTHEMNVIIHWEDGVQKPTKGMLVNLLAHGDSPYYGRAHFDADGGPITLSDGAAYLSLCYDYYVEDIYFKHETDMDQIHAYSPSMMRSTYSKVYPDEQTVAEATYPFWVDRISHFPVDGNDMHFYPENVVQIFTFEIRGVAGAAHISSTRGGIGGMSALYYLTDGALASEPATVLFNAQKDGVNNKIVGSFRTFGALHTRANKFVIEILYPSKTEGIIQASWDVTNQVRRAEELNYHIIIENDGQIPPIIPDDDERGSGFEADVKEWEDVYVTIPV